MKKIMIFAAFAAALSLASCQKEGLNEVVKNDPSAVSESPVFTGTINAGTKTTVDAASGKVSWETTDEITVTDKDRKTAVYSIESIDGTTGRATFVYKSGNTLGEGPYTATYGTAPATDQTYSATPGKLYMTATATSGTSLEFTVQCALMEINLTKSGESVSSVAVTGTPTDGTETTYTLTCTEAQSIESTKSFYIAVPAGVYNKIEITDSDDKVCTLTAASGITVTANHIKPLTFAGSKLDFKSNLPDGALPGLFTVGIGADGTAGTADDVQVRFSKGNLYAKNEGTTESPDWKWHFYDEQYKYNSIATSSGSRTAADTDTEIDLFTWGYNATYSVKPTGSDFVGGHDTEGNKQLKHSTDGDDCGVAYCNSNNIAVGTWRTLSTAEWQYLFNGRDNASNLYKGGVTVCGKTNCVVLLHDNWEWDETADEHNVGTGWQDGGYPETQTGNEVTWERMEKAGAVCLPAAGYRSGSIVYNVGDNGYYWSATANDEYGAFSVYFFSYYVRPSSGDYRGSGCSVRLITESY